MMSAKRRNLSARVGTSYRSYRRNRRGPYRAGGFYGASVRSAAERKVVDTAPAAYNVNTTGSVTLLNGVSTGTDFTERIGRRINITAIQARGYCGQDIVGPAGVNDLRLMIIEDVQCNGVIATIADIFTNATSTSFMNMNNRERFKVHWDRRVTLGPIDRTATTSYAGSPQTSNFNVYKRCNIPVVFEGTSAGIGSISSGALYFVVLGNTAAGQSDAFVTAAFRCRFIDG